MLHPVEFGLVEPEAIRTGNKETTVWSHNHAAFPDTVADDFDILQTSCIVAQACSRDAFAPDLHCATLG